MIYKSKLPLKQIEHITREVIAETEKRRLNVFGAKIPCKSGCSHCCSRQIHMTLGEAYNIRVNLVASRKYEEVKERMGVLKQYENLDPMTWFKMNIKCPILDPKTNKCLAYEVRPLTCAIHFVESDPDSCDPWSMKVPRFQPIDMIDIFEKAVKNISKVSSKNYWSISLIAHRALEASEKMDQLEGLSLDEVMGLVARNL